MEHLNKCRKNLWNEKSLQTAGNVPKRSPIQVYELLPKIM